MLLDEAGDPDCADIFACEFHRPAYRRGVLLGCVYQINR